MISPSDGASRPPAMTNLRALPGIGAPRIFRSSALCSLSAASREELHRLDLAAVIDLRELSEITVAPDERIVVVTHGTLIRTVLDHAYQISTPRVNNGEVAYVDAALLTRPISFQKS